MGDKRSEPELPRAWALWREVVRTFAFWRLIADALGSRQAWSQWAWDYVSGLRERHVTRRLTAILDGASDEDVRRVVAIGRLNHRRLAASARWMAIAFVTVPASAALTLSQLAPEVARQLTDFDLDSLVALGLLGLIVLYQLVCAWQARQVLNLLEIAAIDRGLFHDGGDDEAEEPAIEPPIGA